MKYPKSWNAQHNMYGLSVSHAGAGGLTEDRFTLSVYAMPPKGPRRRIQFTMDVEHAEALAEALRARVASSRLRQTDRPVRDVDLIS